jgi:hypothetical protein
MYRHGLRKLFTMLRDGGLPVPGKVEDVVRLEKEAGGLISEFKIAGPLKEFFEQQVGLGLS